MTDTITATCSWCKGTGAWGIDQCHTCDGTGQVASPVGPLGWYDVEVERTELILFRVHARSPEDAEVDFWNGDEVGAKTTSTSVRSVTATPDNELPVIRRTVCRLCGHDVEGPFEDGSWRDRGNGVECLPYQGRGIHRGETMQPPDGQTHEGVAP